MTDIFKTLLFHIARRSGFSSKSGLYEGKMGIAILLYHGAKFLNSEELEQVANYLIDDIIDERERFLTVGFKNGLSGIAWSFNHLRENNFVELEPDFFDDIDDILLQDIDSLKQNKYEYPWWGIYLHARSNSNISNWGDLAFDYIRSVEDFMELYKNNYLPIMPFLYCLWQWHEKGYKFVDDALCNIQPKLAEIIKEPTNNSYVLHWLCSKLSGTQLDFPFEFNFDSLKTTFFYKLLFNNLPFPSMSSLNQVFDSLVVNQKLHEEFLYLCNHNNIGLTQNISGFTWSLLQYLKEKCDYR